MQLRREPMANPRGATLRQSNALPSVGGAPSHYGSRGGPPPGNALQAKGGEEEEAPPSHNLWVGNVPGETTELMLMEVFAKFGEIDSVKVYPLRNYAFVYFKHIEHAKAAKEGLQGVAMGDSFLRIEFARAVALCACVCERERYVNLSAFVSTYQACQCDFSGQNWRGDCHFNALEFSWLFNIQVARLQCGVVSFTSY